MNLRKITVKYMGWCPGIEAAARFIPDREIYSARATVGALFDLGTSIWLSTFILALIGMFSGVSYLPLYSIPSLFLLGQILSSDAKLFYLTSFPPEFFHRGSFWLERFAMIISVALSGAVLLYLCFFGPPLNLWTFLLWQITMYSPSFIFCLKLQKELQGHSEKDVLLNGFYNSSLVGRALLRIGLGPIMRRFFF